MRVTYAPHLKIFTQQLNLDGPSQEAILGKTAQRLWFAKAVERFPGLNP